MAAELNRYNKIIDTAALCETRLADEGSLTEVGDGYTFFWKGLTSDFQRIRGLGFAIRVKSITRLLHNVAINERLMTLRALLVKSRFMTIICTYARHLTLKRL